MKRILSVITLTTLLSTTPALQKAIAGFRMMPKPADLSYRFYDTRINLTEKPDQVAVVFKPNNTRQLNDPPTYLKLQADLQGQTTTRTTNPPPDLKIEVKPLGTQYAILTLPKTRSIDFSQKLKQRLEQSYVQTTLPVFKRKNGEIESTETIILNDEMLITFEPGTSPSKIKQILDRSNAEIVRPLRFTKDRYLVRSRNVSGSNLFAVIDQIGSTTGVQSASPNFIQSMNHSLERKDLLTLSAPEPAIEPKQLLTPSPNQPFPTSQLSRQWHLDSRRSQTSPGPRTDVRAPEAWAKSRSGKGAIVAVIDSAIQWDHPDLRSNLYEVPQTLANLMPKERYGWDFSSMGTTITCIDNSRTNCAPGDPDTRMDATEIAQLRPQFQLAFQPDAQILQAYPDLADRIQRQRKYSPEQAAELIRRMILNPISAEFHGTWVSGVVAASPQETGSVVGVAPNAKILPVRVFGLGGEITGAILIEAIGYSAARGADVINLSLGSLLPTQAEADQIFSVLDARPDLVIVAAAGNENLDGAGYPAAIPGVLSVGATNLEGNRSPFSNFGRRLDLTAPGGDTSLGKRGGILTTGGTWIPGFWEGLQPPSYSWGPTIDTVGKYVQVQGTSFSSPVVAGVVALMKGEDPDRKLTRSQILEILGNTATYQPLKVTKADDSRYRLQEGIPSTVMPGRSGGVIGSLPGIIDASQVKKMEIQPFYFGKGLVNAEAAVLAVQKQVSAVKP